MNEYDKTANVLTREEISQRFAYNENQIQTGQNIGLAGLVGNPIRTEIKERIQHRLNKARKKVKICEELLGLLEKNKDTERILELLNQYF